MFDPTVFENLKVAIENQLYDLDNLDRKVDITNRKDLLDMAVMSREFALQFTLAAHKAVTAELRLGASLKELAAEILEQEGAVPACTLRLCFYMRVERPEEKCGHIDRLVQQIWKPEKAPKQTISYVFGEEPVVYSNRIGLDFSRKINEEQMHDIPELIDHMLLTLTELNAFAANSQRDS
ncbi:hypothetical protein [Paenibacillus harenae]|uniref:hypothetical protein n=1 Tax=Paenibacillus harenae TaxID=306543 RepID=UPI0004133495|nr:hypothetical protein [Paenibacillus harenae]